MRRTPHGGDERDSQRERFSARERQNQPGPQRREYDANPDRGRREKREHRQQRIRRDRAMAPGDDA